MKSAIVLATIAGASAFAPTQHGTRTSTSMSVTAAQKEFFGLSSTMDFSKELGVQPPVRIYVENSIISLRRFRSIKSLTQMLS
jgi:hypothetical protein